MRVLASALVALSACFPAATRAVAVQCDIDGLWHQPVAVSGSPQLVTAAIKSATGAGRDFRVEQALPSYSSRAGGGIDVPEGYYAVYHAAIGCASGGCLTSSAHGCRQIHSGSSTQCVWEGGEDAAASACSAWEQCDGFWCGPAVDVPGSNASWCWARGATDVMNAKVFQGATAFIKTDLPHLIELKCTSDGCPWIWATGAWDRQTNKLSVTFDNGNKTTAIMHGNCSEIEWADGAVWRNEMQLIERVHVVYMAHFDVGYTSPNVEALLDVYATQYFPQVFSVSESIRSKYPDRADLQYPLRNTIVSFKFKQSNQATDKPTNYITNYRTRYKWTSHPWLLNALLQNQTGTVPAGFADKLEAAIRRGDVLYHANPMNMQSEAGELLNMDAGMAEAEMLDSYFAQEKKVAASQKDEPGATLGMVRMFSRHGVKMLHIGANDFSTVPALPSISAAYHGFCNPFLWTDSELPSGSELLMLYCSGYSGSYELGIEAPNMMAVVPGSADALAYLMHVDNRGPQSEAQVLEGIAAVHRNFPNAEVMPSSMDAWTKAILANVSALSLPVVTDAEPGSTWVQGVASDPYKIRRYRAVARVAAQAVAAGRVDVEDPRYLKFQDLLLKEPEHTWGVASGCEGDFTDKQFYDPKYECTFGTAMYNTTVKSFVDQRQFIDRAVAALEDMPLRVECEAALADAEPAVPEITDLMPFTVGPHPIVLSNDISVTFNGSGAIVGLTRSSGRKLASPEHPIGLFSYAKHSGAVLDHWGSTYGLAQCATTCGHCAFSKCNYPASIKQAVWSAVVTSAWSDTDSGLFVFNLTFGSTGVLDSPRFGAPTFSLLTVKVSAAANDPHAVQVSYDLSWFGKPATRAAESLWFTVAPLDYPREGWSMEKLGRWVDPLRVPINGSRTRHAVWSGVRHSDGRGGFDAEINTTDAAVIVVGPNAFDPNGAIGADVQAHPEEGWAFNLFNNAWATNFPAFSIDKDQRFRFDVRLR